MWREISTVVVQVQLQTIENGILPELSVLNPFLHCSSLLSGCKDGTVRIWTRAGGKWDQVICNTREHRVPDRDVKELIIVNFVQVKITIFSYPLQISMASSRPPGPTPHLIHSLPRQWSVDEGRVIASCSDTSIRMWNLQGELVQTFLGHHDDSYFIQEHPRVPE